jgi:predicted acetyltransferase
VEDVKAVEKHKVAILDKPVEKHKVRILEKAEHGKTRKLWEEVFQEDEKPFLDYYYFLKAKENEISVIETDGDIRAMLHLNPYQIQIEDTTVPSNYIVAVATQEAYRRRGYLRELMLDTMQRMYAQKMPFVFLMPAAESIYAPYDFRFVYAQRQGKWKKRRNEIRKTDDSESSLHKVARRNFNRNGQVFHTQVQQCDAMLWDATEMCAFFHTICANRMQVYAVRDEAYYQTMMMEQQSEQGGVRLLKVDGKLVGMFAYAMAENRVEVREPLYLPEYRFAYEQALLECSANGTKEVVVYGDAGKPEGSPLYIEEKNVPRIMVRCIHLESLLSMLYVHEGEMLDCSFAVIDPWLHKNSRVFRLTSDGDTGKIRVRESEDSQGVLTIGALTSLLFGYQSIEEIAQEEAVLLPEGLQKEFAKIRPLQDVYLNEVV